MDLSVSIIDDEHELNQILKSTNVIDEYELIHLPMKQSGDSSHKHTGVERLPLWIQQVYVRRGWHHLKEVQRNFFRDLTLASGVLCLPSILL